MGLYLHKLLRFLLLIPAILMLLMLFLSRIEKLQADFKIASAPRFIVAGNSHPECAFNDSLIPNFKNVAQSGEAYFYTYVKLKQVLEQNPSIETVFVEFSNDQVNKSTDRWIWDSEYMDYRYKQYSSFLELYDNWLLATHNPLGYLNTLSVALKQKVERISKKDFAFYLQLGGYKYLERYKTDSLLLVLEETPRQPEQFSLSKYNIRYLIRIIRLCEERKRKVVIIRSPQHEKCRYFSNEVYYQEIRKKLFPHVDYIDFTNFPISNHEFGDFEHLNHIGARRFSIWFATRLEKYLLNGENPEVFITQTN